MDRLNQLRGEAGDSTLDTSSPPSEAFMSANESSSKYFSLSEVDSTFTTSSKDTRADHGDSECSITEDPDIISNLSPIPKTDIETFKIGKHIEAANILSGGVNIFDDNDNSYEGDELVIDDNVVLEDEKTELKLSEGAAVPLEKDVIEDIMTESLDEAEPIPSKDTEVVLQIDGKNVDAIDIGNGLYLYRKSGEKELSAVQIIDDDQQQPSFKFLKVRENMEGNLEVYEEIQIELPKELPPKDSSTENTTFVPNKDKGINDPCNRVTEINKSPKFESNSTSILPLEPLELQSEVNLNGKMKKFNESRKSPLIFAPMTYHSTPIREGIPLTKTMVDQQLHPSRHSDNIKKTIEVHTEINKPKIHEAPNKSKERNETIMTQEPEISFIRTKENYGPITIAEHSQKESEIFNKEKKYDVMCHLLQQGKEQNEEFCKETSGIKNISKGKDCAEKLSEETTVIIENKNICNEITQASKNKKSNEEITVTSQSGIVPSELKETSQSKKQQQDNQDTRKQTADEKNENKPVNDMSDCKSHSKETKINEREKDVHSINEHTGSSENIMGTDKSIESRDVILTNEIIIDCKFDTDRSQPINKDNRVQLTNPIIDQVLTEKLKLSSIFKKKLDSEIAGLSEKETKRNDVVEKISTQSKHLDDQNIKTIADEGHKSNTISGSSKDNIDNNDIGLKINKVTRNESDNLNKNEVVSKVYDPQVLTHTINISAEPKNLNVIDNKNIQEEDLVNPIVPAKKDIVESQRIAKAVVDSSKIPCKIKDTTQIIVPKKVDTKKEVAITKIIAKSNTCNSAVPFGKWTEANRQEFLNKIKESKITSNNSNTNQIKQTNDLNRRDVLKKFDSQRQSTAVSTKILDFGSVPKFSSKMETAAFVNKSAAIQQANPVKPIVPPLKAQVASVKTKIADTKKPTAEEILKSEEQIINSQELIDKTVEGIITRALKMKTTTPIHMKQQMTIHTVENPKDAMPLPGSLDYIEMKMNELHGFALTEKSVLSHSSNHNTKPCIKFEDMNINKNSKIPNLLPFKVIEQQKVIKERGLDETSDEEIIEHEPITGDIDVNNQNLISLLTCKEKIPKKDAVITETDFDKFAGKNSITYENCLTVNFDSKEKHNVVQTGVQKETSVKKLSRNELLLAESKAKSSSKLNTVARHNNQTSKTPINKITCENDTHNETYLSKVQIAYQSALTAKRHLECPISIIEDKPVKVLYMDTNAEYTPTKLNAQGQELSRFKNHKSEVHSASETMDSDILETTQDHKPLDEKLKVKHQRKQVLTPVEQEPEIQLIEPSNLGIKSSPTKKRKIEEKSEKNTKILVPKKSYLLNRSVVDEHNSKLDQPKSEDLKDFKGHNISTALDNLVKAAELIENQSEGNGANMTSHTTETSMNTPVKRGRGRPRKYPLPELGSETAKPPSPPKKPRLIDAKPSKTYSDEISSDENSDGEMIKENWTMGKINENIVCPICSKLFRSEDVLFKHVKHCTGPSPNRSDSDKRSPRRLRSSQELERNLLESGSDTEEENDDENIKGRKASVLVSDSEDVIVIEDTPINQRLTNEKTNHPETKKYSRKPKHLHNTNLVCEFCGKTFRQLSYLVNHKLQHKNEDLKMTNKLESDTTNKSVFSCEVCRKEFRKLHHLVQHRIIHNPSSTSSRSSRKTSSEVHESKYSKTQSDDTVAGFRCEPCDKSFRKLHHLVEHRETHDGINKKVNTSTSQATIDTSKSGLTHSCDICKKYFKKLQDLLEHKEQHYETSSEKSDDKSVKSSLSTKDIIHECSLCYMVFPNEHSLTKHTVICLRKKKQSAAKQVAKQSEINENVETPDLENVETEKDVSQVIQFKEESQLNEDSETPEESRLNNFTKIVDQGEDPHKGKANKDDEEELEEIKYNLDMKPSIEVMSKKRPSNLANEKTRTYNIEPLAKFKKAEVKECVKTVDTPTPKKKANKDKKTLTTKNHKTVNCSLPDVGKNNEIKPMESSDEDDIRYMLNPNFKEEENIDMKMFMEVRALKRSSLQIERPSSKDLAKRSISLQYPSKMPRLKAKPVVSKPNFAKSKVTDKKPDTIIELTTDSDDSEIKYSFPEQVTKSIKRKAERQSQAVKRKSLVGIKKRKSLVKTSLPKGKPRKRTSEVEHRCDCGMLFSSAALLSRHTTLDHTPPRIRRRRSPPPDPSTKRTTNKPTNTKPTNKQPKPDVTNSNKTLGVATRKSSVSNETKQSNTGKSVKSDNFKYLRSAKSVPESDRVKKIVKKK